jgi:hypothetical protein
MHNRSHSRWIIPDDINDMPLIQPFLITSVNETIKKEIANKRIWETNEKYFSRSLNASVYDEVTLLQLGLLLRSSQVSVIRISSGFNAFVLSTTLTLKSPPFIKVLAPSSEYTHFLRISASYPRRSYHIHGNKGVLQHFPRSRHFLSVPDSLLANILVFFDAAGSTFAGDKPTPWSTVFLRSQVD